MPPKRKAENRHLTGISNLQCRDGYYSWRDPRDGTEHGLGRKRSTAMSEAAEANVWLEDQQKKPRLLEKLKGVRTIGSFCDRYRKLLDKREASPVTRSIRRGYVNTIEGKLGWVPVGASMEACAELTGIVAGWLREYEEAGKLTMAGKLKDTLVDMFACMAGDGWVAVNPIKVIETEAPKVRRARLSIENYIELYNAAGKLAPWVQRSMELGIVSLQRREDIAVMQFSEVREARLHVEQLKTGVRLRIPLALRLEAVGLTLGDVRDRCRDDVVSRFLVHHMRSRGNAKAGGPVKLDTITAAFAEARDLAGVTVEPGSTPPTFHELRSLGARLYEEQGYDPQNLLGHKNPQMTRVYTDRRGSEWIEVAA